MGLPNQPLLLTSGRDNSMRMWIFDTPDGLPRLLKSRCGCPGPARRMSFYGADNDKDIIIGGAGHGAGYVAKMSFILEHQNNTYSQAALRSRSKVQKLTAAHKFLGTEFDKLPPIVDMAFCSIRHFDWPAVVTAHEKLGVAFLWSAEH